MVFCASRALFSSSSSCARARSLALDRIVPVKGWVGDGVLSDGESGGRLDGVPVLLSEGVGPLLQALLALGQSLVLANRHVCGMSRSCRD